MDEPPDASGEREAASPAPGPSDDVALERPEQAGREIERAIEQEAASEVEAGPVEQEAAREAEPEPVEELDVVAADQPDDPSPAPSAALALLALVTVVVTAVFALTYQDDITPALISTSPSTTAGAAAVEGAAPPTTRRTTTTRPVRPTTTRPGTTVPPVNPTSSTTADPASAASTSTVPQSSFPTTVVTTAVPPTFITSTTTTAQPTTTVRSAVTVSVSNRATLGMGMKENPPLALVTVPGSPCVLVPGCQSIPGTAFGTGDSIVAVCQADRKSAAFGYATNGDDSTTADDANPELVKSWRWYGIRFNQTVGFVSEVWIAAAHRGGVGLPACTL